MFQPTCCTCASLLPAVPRVSSSSPSEKPVPDGRRLSCCGRIICGVCIHNNPRFSSYCPYCQTSGAPLPLSDRFEVRPRRSEAEAELQSESDHPPPYSAIAQTIKVKLNTTEPADPPPPYSPSSSSSSSPTISSSTPRPSSPKQPPAIDEKATAPAGYAIHHLRHPPHPHPDTLASISLRYGIPLPVLRRHNNLPSDADYLLAARNTVLIPAAYIIAAAGGGSAPDGTPASGEASLSPHPVEDAAERGRKKMIRRFMVACKEADYDAAVVYLEQSGYDFEEAVARHREDAEWERRNPLQAGQKKGMGRYRSSRSLLSRDSEGSRGGGRGSLLGWLKGRERASKDWNRG
ncbi:hypothetical protein MYCTH_2304187 [Thermothelomyces thermophilus ATCC 42464]|uniref:LysM domain-containing protein n=1 Tax=Thermothelomyces thermophilus (strain ATCC 42464 / BCRC 31852 / DSM 1799) TaxID=573729 RepID=G2QEB5_THET4|nr:uncharacterized protein MYCTH_2304187 [Thermothelomyces thermophilus ATCC 42464]AEO57698.1 hypothetical protein MYCTH_2304187 [Thermothelomyces thermophilus ATCC 42464]